MSLTRPSRQERWTWDSYLQWEMRQPRRYELVDGEIFAMTSGTADHDTISTNLAAELRALLRGGPCRAHGANLKIRAGSNGRYPDASIDCGPRDGEALFAREPVAVFEVLSKSTSAIDQSLKRRDYEAVASVTAYVLVDQTMPRVLCHARDVHGGFASTSMSLVEGLHATLELPVLGLAIPLGAIYEGVDFAS